jgi:tRNA-2-methylthio-N6-dimethylallyladenosine synthase
LENSEIQATKNSDLGKGRGVFISTYGCQMNVNDTERMYSLLEMSNFTPVSSADQAELIIINSCSVREKPVHKVYSEVGTYKKLKDKNPNLKIGVGGCVGSQEKQSLIADAPLIDFVFGTDNIDTLPQLVNKTLSGVAKTAKERKLNLVDTNFRHREPYHIETLVRNPGVATFVNITKGCDNFCTFCVVPYTRGHSSRSECKFI